MLDFRLHGKGGIIRFRRIKQPKASLKRFFYDEQKEGFIIATEGTILEIGGFRCVAATQQNIFLETSILRILSFKAVVALWCMTILVGCFSGEQSNEYKGRVFDSAGNPVEKYRISLKQGTPTGSPKDMRETAEYNHDGNSCIYSGEDIYSENIENDSGEFLLKTEETFGICTFFIELDNKELYFYVREKNEDYIEVYLEKENRLLPAEDKPPPGLSVEQKEDKVTVTVAQGKNNYAYHGMVLTKGRVTAEEFDFKKVIIDAKQVGKNTFEFSEMTGQHGDYTVVLFYGEERFKIPALRLAFETFSAGK